MSSVSKQLYSRQPSQSPLLLHRLYRLSTPVCQSFYLRLTLQRPWVISTFSKCVKLIPHVTLSSFQSNTWAKKIGFEDREPIKLIIIYIYHILNHNGKPKLFLQKSVNPQYSQRLSCFWAAPSCCLPWLAKASSSFTEQSSLRMHSLANNK